MQVYFVILIGIALGMDAFGVNLAVGINNKIFKKDKIQYGLSCAIFQGLFCFLGGFLGNIFEKSVAMISNNITAIIIGIVGILMFINGWKNEEESILGKGYMKILLGISVSIDALVIGFSMFHHIEFVELLLLYSILIGLITLTMCLVASFIASKFKKINFIKKYCNYISGIVLILFAISLFFNENLI